MPNDSQENESSNEKDEFIFDLISSRNKDEFERSNILDTKASGVIGFAGIIIGLLGALISFLLEKLSRASPIFYYYQSFRVVLLLGIVSLAGSIFFCILAYSIKTYAIVPKTSTLIEKYAKDQKKTKYDVIRVVGTEISEAIKENSRTDDDKAKFVKCGLYLFALGMGLTVIFVCGLLVI